MPTPKPSIGAPARSSSRDAVLVEPAAREDVDGSQSAVIEDAAHTLGGCDQIAAVEAHAADGDAVRLQPRRQRDHLARAASVS